MRSIPLDTELPSRPLFDSLPVLTPLTTVLILAILASLLAALAAQAAIAGRTARCLHRDEASRALWGALASVLISTALFFIALGGISACTAGGGPICVLIALTALSYALLLPAVGMVVGHIRGSHSDRAGRLIQAGMLAAGMFTWWLPKRRKKAGSNGNGDGDTPEFEITMASGEEVEAEEREYIENILEMGDTVAREVMKPRTDVVALDASWEPERIINVIADARFSRFPVYDGSIDNIIGVLHLRDMLEFLARGEGTAALDIRAMLMEPNFVPESRKIDDVLRDLQLRKGHMAVVLDEYGGTAGILTIEDLLEEIVGEIQDEYDDETREAHQREDGSWIVAAHMTLDDLNELLDASLKADDVDTLGGYITNAMGRIPKTRETVDVLDQGLRFTVLSVDRNRLRRVLVERSEA
jgi:Mg2+/Co2+ transporter CorC